jgi:hypothetical protein
MNSISPSIQDPTTPAVFAMLSYSTKFLLAETSVATVKPNPANSTLDDLAHRSNAITLTLKTVEGYIDYGIND